MTEPLRFIHLESNPADAELISTTLRDAGIPCQSKRTQTREEFLAALRQDGTALFLPTPRSRDLMDPPLSP